MNVCVTGVAEPNARTAQNEEPNVGGIMNHRTEPRINVERQAFAAPRGCRQVVAVTVAEPGMPVVSPARQQGRGMWRRVVTRQNRKAGGANRNRQNWNVV